MKELDFDELDRAVNTLMGDVPQAPARQPDDDDRMTTLDIPSTLSDNQAMPAYTPPVEPTTTPSQAPVVNTPAPAARRGGRFMDVVHPSSDMKTASNTPARPVSRQGTMISPILPAKQPETSPSSLVAEPAPTPTPDTDTSAWPDPLDMAGYQREPDTTTPDAEVAVSVPEEVVVDTPTALEEPAETPAAIIEPDEEQPLSTPFLSDAKVEKRPLGTNSAEEPDHAPVMSNAAAPEDTPDAESQLPATPDLAPVVLPEELQTDVLSIESDDTSPELPEVNDEIHEDTHEDTLTPAIEAVTAAEAPASASTGGPTSIQQQYKEQPSTGDQAMGGIYDTESLHQPLGHPAKKKSGWMWVIWVLVLLILGAAGGAAAYLYLLK